MVHSAEGYSSDHWSRIEELFHAALERPPAERASFVAGSCANDSDLEAQVTRLLDAHVQSDEFMEPPEVDFPAGLEGRQLGGYRIIREIASGGMGTVYEALQDNPSRRVAIKVMRADLASAASRRRFELEAAVLGRLAHPGIAQIFEAGTYLVDGRRLPYYAMEYIPDAQSILEYAREGGLQRRERLELFAAVCDAVSYGHQQGIIHRDLKPANILVDAAGHPKVIDFGVARVVSSGNQTTTAHTSAGQLIGTLRYLSPDQMSGGAHESDIRTDVYALGVILYELLCGEPPYDLADKSITQAALIIRDTAPRRPAGVNPALRGDLETIILKAIAKERQERYQSASEFAGDVRSFLNHEPIRARPPSATYQLRMFARRHRALVAASVTVLMIVITAAIVSGVFWRREAAQRLRAEHIAQVERDQREKAEKMKAYLVEVLSSANPALGRQHDVSVREMLEEVAPRLSSDLGHQPDLEAEMHGVVGQTYRGLGILDAAEDHLRRSLELYRSVADGSSEHLGAILQLGAVQYQRGEYGEAELLYREAIALSERLYDANHLRVAESLLGLGETLRMRHDHDQAEPLLRRALAIFERYPKEDDGGAANGLALMYDAQGRFEEAEELFVLALERTKAVHGEDHQHAATGLNNLAALYFERGQYEKAREMFQQALQIYRRLLGDDHVLVAHAQNNLGVVLLRMGALAEAEHMFHDSLAVHRRALGEEHPHFASSLNNIGSLLADQGKFEEALPVLQRVLELRLQLFPPEHPDIVSTRCLLARATLATGSIDQAESQIREALGVCRQTLPAAHPSLANALTILGEVLVQRGDHAAAIEALEEALGVWRQAHAEVGPPVIRTEVLLGVALTGEGRWQEAETVLLKGYSEATRQLSSRPEFVRRVARALAGLYEQWGKEPEAAAYRRLAGHSDPGAEQAAQSSP